MRKRWPRSSKAISRPASSSLMAGWHWVRTCRPRKSAGWCWSIRHSRSVVSSIGWSRGSKKAHRRWPGGIFALWYPIKDRKAVAAFREELANTGIAKIMDIEFYIRQPSSEPRLDGTGMVVVNPPFQLEGELQVMLPALGKLLVEGPGARWSVEWLAGEAAAS
jgi:hypothetical protein